MMPIAPGFAAGEEYDRQYRVWVERQGPRALDLDWRMTHLLWRHRALLRRYSPEGKRVLDFGCMDGVFTLKLQELGGETVGYDISPAAIAQAKVFRGPAARPVFTTVPPGPGQFDRIYCQEVLEHVEDDSGLIGELVGYLAPGGSVVGTTPVGRYFWDPDHKRMYDEVMLKRALGPWGRVRLHRYYRSPLRNLVPIRQDGAAVFIFEVTPPSPPGAR
ncbi:MAG TPA: class I SAM-dependent methyltransferase [Gemmatimonadales bacterium]|nr:class I SAM-dependent methyltransferase [Gemmatimonadales bacterium]